MRNRKDLSGVLRPGLFLFVIILFFISGLNADANPLTGSGRPRVVRPPSQGLSPELSGLQYRLREKIAELMSSVSDNPSHQVFMVFFSAAFLYGIIHAAGPGHRKGIIFAIFISKKTSPLEPFLAGFYSAFLHAGSGVIMILFFKYVLNRTALFIDTDIAASYLEGFTFISLGLLALFLVISRILKIASSAGKAGSSDNLSVPVTEPVSVSGADRGHGRGRGTGRLFLLITAASLFPCPGALMILLFSLSLDILYAGIIGVVFMSAGMGLVVSAVGFLARSGRSGLFRQLKKHQHAAETAGAAIEILSYSFLAIFSFWMAWPMLLFLKIV